MSYDILHINRHLNLVIYKKNRCDYIRVTQYNTSMLLTLFTYVSALQYKTKTTNKDLKRINKF